MTKKTPGKPSAILIFRPDRNSPRKSDYTGAFRPESDEFAEYHESCGRRVFISEIDVSKPMPARRREVLAVLAHFAEEYVIDCVAFFCHGWPDGIQMGFTRRQVKQLARALRAANPTGNATIVPIFGCLTGKGVADGDGNFADMLRDAMCVEGLIHNRVMGHTTKGRTAQNAHARRFDGLGSPTGGQGGTWIVQPGHALWRKWVRAIDKTDLRFRFPWMAVEKIHAELVA